jgi:DNA-binding MarR family transcriptional regulator
MRFYKLPKILFEEDKYKNISLESKVLYSFLLDRLSLSAKNRFVDKDGRVYVIFSRKEAAEKLSVSQGSAVKYFKELKEAGLIFEKRGKQKEVKSLYITKIEPMEIQLLNLPVSNSESVELQNLNPNKTDINKTDLMRIEEEERELSLILENCELEIWYDGTGEILEKSITELFYTESLKANGRSYTKAQIRRQLYELDGDCLIYVVDCMKEKQGRIKNPALYLKTAILNAKRDYLAFSKF